MDQKNQAPTDNHSPQGHNITNLVLLYNTPHSKSDFGDGHDMFHYNFYQTGLISKGKRSGAEVISFRMLVPT